MVRFLNHIASILSERGLRCGAVYHPLCYSLKPDVICYVPKIYFVTKWCVFIGWIDPNINENGNMWQFSICVLLLTPPVPPWCTIYPPHRAHHCAKCVSVWLLCAVFTQCDTSLIVCKVWLSVTCVNSVHMVWHTSEWYTRIQGSKDPSLQGQNTRITWRYI